MDRDIFRQSERYFPTQNQLFQYFDKYSRYDYGLGRRETWIETVNRVMGFLYELGRDRILVEDYDRIKKFILNMEAMPSMRLVATAGEAARRNNISIYNCSYLPVKDVKAFGEALYISMSGCGVGYSVESKYVEQLPSVKIQNGKTPRGIIVEDHTEGWKWALEEAIYALISGYDIDVHYHLLRPAGSVLKIKGGHASGPEPLEQAINKIRRIIINRQGKKLRPIDAHDIMCLTGSAAVSGGVRRTAMISLFDLDDEEMLRCKDGDFYVENSQRWNANNSVVVNNSIGGDRLDEILSEMVAVGRGEPGIFNRESSVTNAPIRRNKTLLAECGTNPCGEIILRPYQFCNLSIAVARQDDDYESLANKVEVATILGCIQSLGTNFPELRYDWVRNAEDERLLGVDITGQMDSPIVQDAEVMRRLKAVATRTAKDYSWILGVNHPASITTVKPSGNSAQLLNVSSGIHSRWSKYYIRHSRVSRHSPILKAIMASGYPYYPEVGQDIDTATTYVIPFPIASPDGALTRHDRSAMDQCEYWLRSKLNWTEHNPSVTITYKPNEVEDLKRWIKDNIGKIGGMSFLPAFDAKYDLLPYVEITEDEYDKMISELPYIDFSLIPHFEHEDQTTASQELACFAGSCEVEL